MEEGHTKKQLIGIALILFGIYFVIPYELFYGWGTVIGLVLGVIGLVFVIEYSGKDHRKIPIVAFLLTKIR